MSEMVSIGTALKDTGDFLAGKSDKTANLDLRC